MPEIPFSSLLLLALLLLTGVLLLSKRNEYRRTGGFIVACAILLMAAMIRREWPTDTAWQLQPLLAAFLPSLAWLCFARLTPDKTSFRLLSLTLPFAAVIMTLLCWPSALDVLLFFLYSGYGCALIKTACKGENVFIFARLSKASTAVRLAFSTGCFLCFSALTDMAISLDFMFAQGSQASRYIAVAQGCMLPFICLAIMLASRIAPVEKTASAQAMPEPEPEPEPELNLAEEQEKMCAQLEKIIREKAYYLDAALTLSALARKVGTPARDISTVVNMTRKCNVSQWINAFRIEKAQFLLQTSSKPVIDIMLETGFVTKSNFNREFLRLSGMTPTAYRRAVVDNAKPHSETD